MLAPASRFPEERGPQDRPPRARPPLRPHPRADGGLRVKGGGDLESMLDRIEQLYEEEDFERALKELQRALKAFPDDLTLREWQAVFTADDGRPEEALGILDRVLAEDADRAFAGRE